MHVREPCVCLTLNCGGAFLGRSSVCRRGRGGAATQLGGGGCSAHAHAHARASGAIDKSPSLKLNADSDIAREIAPLTTLTSTSGGCSWAKSQLLTFHSIITQVDHARLPT